MGLLGLALGLVVLNHVLRQTDHVSHQRMHDRHIPHYHVDKNLHHTALQRRHHGEYDRLARKAFGTRKDRRRYPKR